MKNKVLTCLTLLFSCTALTIGLCSTVFKDHSADSVSADSFGSEPSYYNSSDLVYGQRYYFYCDFAGVNSLPNGDSLLGFFGTEWIKQDNDLDSAELLFYPSYEYDGVSYDRIVLDFDVYSTDFHVDLLLSNSSNDELKIIQYNGYRNNNYFYFSYNSAITRYFQGISSVNDIVIRELFDGSHYLIYQNEYTYFYNSFIGCFGVNSVRNIGVSFVRDWHFNLVVNSNINTSYYAYHNTYGYNCLWNWAFTNYSYMFGSQFNSSYSDSRNIYWVVRIYDGLLNYNGAYYSGAYLLLKYSNIYDGYDSTDYITSNSVHLFDSTERDNNKNNYIYYADSIFLTPYVNGWTYYEPYTIGSCSSYYDSNNNYIYNGISFNWYDNIANFDLLYMNYNYSPSLDIFKGFNGNYFSFFIYGSNSVTYNFHYIITSDIDSSSTLLSSFRLISLAFAGLTGLLSFAILPGVTLGMLVAVPFLITIMLFVIGLFKR